MLIVVLIIGVVLIVAAVRNSQAALFAALTQDVPSYAVWAAAILALGMLGYVPGLKPVSRGLLILVILVIVLNNYQAVIAGFQNANTAPASSGGSGGGSGDPTGLTNVSTPSALAAITQLISNDTGNGFGSNKVAGK